VDGIEGIAEHVASVHGRALVRRLERGPLPAIPRRDPAAVAGIELGHDRVDRGESVGRGERGVAVEVAADLRVDGGEADEEARLGRELAALLPWTRARRT